MPHNIMCHICNDLMRVSLVTGKDIYPNSERLADIPFWQCTYCNSYVGCHPNTIKPLGTIVGSLVKKYRQHVHTVLDPIWQSGAISRSKVYQRLSQELGWKYHTASIRSVKEAKQVLALIDTLFTIKITPIEGDFL